MEQSLLKGTNVGNQVFEGANHDTILDNVQVANQDMEYLKNTSPPLVNNYPANDPDDRLLPGDVNGDGKVDIFDLVSVAATFNVFPPSNFLADINGDGGGYL